MEVGVQLRAMDQPGDLGWVVMLHGEDYAREYGWDQTFEASVARILADFGSGHDPAREAGWVAEVDGRRAGAVLIVAQGAAAKLRVLVVDPAARGAGVGESLVRQAISFAREAGYVRVELWTNDVLTAAIRLYERLGFRLVGTEQHHSYGVNLVGLTYALDL